MNTAEELKKIVKDKYSEIASQSKEQNEASCCGATGCGTVDYAIFADNYTELEGYNPDADLGLGCGVPTEFARIRKGDTVVDLGSGAGNDCFVARALTGEGGKVIGVDMTEAMIAKARENADKLGFNNVEFRQLRAQPGTRQAQGICRNFPRAEAGGPLQYIGCGTGR
jgi:SAM-dependent methyltransferase